MIRVYRSSRLPLFWVLVAVPLFLLLSLPLLALGLALACAVGILRWLLGSPRARPGAEPRDPNLSPLIENKEIGPYRVKRNPTDPSVVEVLD
jgi:hypothetical protein